MPRVDQPVRVLPKGRHRLSRGEVSASQRGRILAAVVDLVAQRGYADTSVAAVVERAGVSSKAFYEHFAGKEACFLAAYDAGAEVLRRELGAVLDAPAPPAERVGRAIDRYLDLVAAQPAFARTFLIEVYGAGPRALERRLAAQRRFADAIAATLGVAGDPRARLACAALVGGVVALVTERVGSGAADAADGLRAPVDDLVADWLGLVAPAPRRAGGVRMSVRLVAPAGEPRIPPGSPEEIGRLNALLTSAIGRGGRHARRRRTCSRRWPATGGSSGAGCGSPARSCRAARLPAARHRARHPARRRELRVRVRAAPPRAPRAPASA